MTLTDSLSVLLEDGIIQEVLGRIMSGKEAEVYAVLRNDEAVAAKVYKPRQQRSFKNNAAYVEGRQQVRDSRTRRAIEKGSRFGRSQEEKSWKDMEHDALQLAFHAGVRVPQPIFLYEDTLLMQLVVDEEGMPAPRLSDLSFSQEQALSLHKDLIEQIRRLLKAHRIHGDLSAYNILMGIDGPTIIDLPQVIDAAANLRAEEFLERDVRNVTEYLARFAPSLQQYAAAGRVLWRHYRAGTLDEANPYEVVEGAQQRRKGPPQQQQQRDNRQQRADGRVEVVMNGGNQRRTRGFSRDGRARDGAQQNGRGNGGGGQSRNGEGFRGNGGQPRNGGDGARGNGQARNGGDGARGNGGQPRNGEGLRGNGGQGRNGEGLRGNGGQGRNGEGFRGNGGGPRRAGPPPRRDGGGGRGSPRGGVPA